MKDGGGQCGHRCDEECLDGEFPFGKILEQEVSFAFRAENDDDVEFPEAEFVLAKVGVIVIRERFELPDYLRPSAVVMLAALLLFIFEEEGRRAHVGRGIVDVKKQIRSDGRSFDMGPFDNKLKAESMQFRAKRGNEIIDP